MTERKHLYLITEHENQDHVGRVKLTDERMNLPTKNDEAPFHKYDKENGAFITIGKQVGMGYYDFEEDVIEDDPDRVSEILQDKLREIDDEWLDKAGVDLDD